MKMQSNVFKTIMLVLLLSALAFAGPFTPATTTADFGGVIFTPIVSGLGSEMNFYQPVTVAIPVVAADRLIYNTDLCVTLKMSSNLNQGSMFVVADIIPVSRADYYGYELIESTPQYGNSSRWCLRKIAQVSRGESVQIL